MNQTAVGVTIATILIALAIFLSVYLTQTSSGTTSGSNAVLFMRYNESGVTLEMSVSGNSDATVAQLTQWNVAGENGFHVREQLYQGRKYTWFSTDDGVTWRRQNCKPGTLADLLPGNDGTVASNLAAKNITAIDANHFLVDGLMVTFTNGKGYATAADGSLHPFDAYYISPDGLNAPTVNLSPDPSKVDVSRCDGSYHIKDDGKLNVDKSTQSVYTPEQLQRMFDPKWQAEFQSVKNSMHAPQLQAYKTVDSKCRSDLRPKGTRSEEWYLNWRLSLLAYNNVRETNTRTGQLNSPDSCEIAHQKFTYDSMVNEGLPPVAVGIPDVRTGGWVCKININFDLADLFTVDGLIDFVSRLPSLAPTLTAMLTGNAACVNTDLSDQAEGLYLDKCRHYQNTQHSAATGNPGVHNFVVAHKAGDAADTCYLSFRGSYSSYDWAADFTSAASTLATIGGTQYYVAYGFHSYWAAIQQDVYNALNEQACTKVKITGHSLGGALADAAAFDFWKTSKYQVLQVQTFGAPRYWLQVPPTAYTTYMAGIHKDRLVHGGDPVPTVPFIRTKEPGSEGYTKLLGDVASTLQSFLFTYVILVNEFDAGTLGLNAIPSAISCLDHISQVMGSLLVIAPTSQLPSTVGSHVGSVYGGVDVSATAPVWQGTQYGTNGVSSDFPDRTNWGNGDGSVPNGGRSPYRRCLTYHKDCWLLWCETDYSICDTWISTWTEVNDHFAWAIGHVGDHLKYDQTICYKAVN